MNTIPIQKSDGKWYVNIGTEQAGPYETEDIAYEVLEAYYNSRSCPTGSCDE